MNGEKSLQKHLSPLGAWAFSLGTSIGWGSLVVTAGTYLAKAGPLGSALGLVIGAAIMLVISRCYAYMMRCFPEAGGSYAFTREAFGYDQGFLTAWFLAMTYLAILWANATSLPLFSRIFLGGAFHFGRLYSLFGYDVYLGEVLLTMAAIALTVLVCARGRKLMTVLMIGMVCFFTLGIAVCFIGAAAGCRSSLRPLFVPDSAALGQIVNIAVISPWAFIGFESISHATEEFRFEHGRIRRVMLISVVSALALYLLVTLLSVTAYPPQYDSWLSYIRDLDRLSGLEALPAFYAADAYLGSFGVALLSLSLLSLVVTSLIGNTAALSRLVYGMAKDKLLPAPFARLNDRGLPGNAVLLVGAVSILIPLIGRTAIGWIVDVTTIGATLIYGFVAAGAARIARNSGDRHERRIALAGLGLMIAFGAYILLPNLLWRSTLVRETYFLFILWSVLGFIFFRAILKRDKDRRFGSSVVVWVVLLALVLFVSLIWMRQSLIASNDEMESNVEQYYAELAEADPEREDDREYIHEQLQDLEKDNTKTILMAVGMFAFALVVMLSNHSYMNKRSKEHELLATRDPMTGVKNKHAYLLQEKKLSEDIRGGSTDPFGIVVCDVNGLKKINDTLGHKAGDDYIRSACEMVCDIFQHSPVFRVGGDEFVVVLSGRDYSVRKQLMTLLHDRSVEHIGAGGAVVSGGMSEYKPGVDRSPQEVFERADAMMYEEKSLLKSLGAVTRDEEVEAATDSFFSELGSSDQIITVRKHVLIVDDEEINQEILGTVLEEGYELLYASDGLEAMDQLRARHEQLALVLLDLQMPNMSGMEVLRNMQDDPELRSIPVVVLTADQDAEVECLRLGAMEFIPKPYPAWEIVQARVNKCIELSENRDIIQSTERDHLTRLFNLDYFLRYVKIFDQHYENRPMDAAVVDVNHFHMINERYGKPYGDSILRRIGEGLRKLAREIGGVGGRQGADTFLLYCPHRTDYAELLENLIGCLGGEDAAGSRIRLRMGVYSEVDKTLEIERRFDRAKLAADSVKGSYDHPVGVYDTQVHEAALFKERLLEDFRSSLEQGCFTVHYQPKFDVRQDTPFLSSAEALVRWKHPELGMISPGVFIPLLEENGLIPALDEFVWRSVAAQVRRWKDRFGFSVPVSINVSRIDMLNPNLKDVFADILRTFRLQADDLMLEVTESAYTGESESVIVAARALRDTGFLIEMDDFGTGYSSLGMLMHLPIDALKLDMSFVRSAFGETRDVRLIELIIDIAEYLHVPVVAEGVETEEQCLALKAMGCDLVQGYYFSKPVPSEEFDRFLLERSKRSIDMTPSAKKSYLSMADALSGGFESLWYVDLVTDGYLEFIEGPDGEREIRTGGSDFFADMRAKLLDTVCPEDAPALEALLRKENLNDRLREEGGPLSFRRQAEGRLLPFRLETARVRSTDKYHILVGVRPE